MKNGRKANGKLSSKVRKVVNQQFSAVNRMNAQAWVNVFDKNAIAYDPINLPPKKGTKSIRNFVNKVFKRFKKLRISKDSVFINGNNAAVKWTCRGIGKTGRKIRFEGIITYNVNKSTGKVHQIKSYWDAQRLLKKAA